MTFEILENKNVDSKITFTERTDPNYPGVTFVDMKVEFKEEDVPKPLKIIWRHKITDVYGIQAFKTLYDHHNPPNWEGCINISTVDKIGPLLQLISSDNRNRILVAYSDAVNSTELTAGVKEETAEEEFFMGFFINHCRKMKEYTVTIYIDLNDRYYQDSIKDVCKFWEKECGYEYAYTPEAARKPLYSTWYTLHGNQYADKIITQCELARTYGMETVIIDDGWQCGNDEGSNCRGDWHLSSEKIPDMDAFVNKLHSIGMKVLFWFSLSHCELEAEAYKKFNDKILDRNGWIPTFDPRYSDVREYLVDKIAGQAIKWNLDGVKIDFIDSFNYAEDTPFSDDRRDYESIYDAIPALLQSINDKTKAYKSDFLIEFRQQYYGPAIRKYGNMIRVADCPDDSMRNHVAGTSMRMLLGPQAVHSDMLMWHNDDPIESVANQFLCCMYLVPQISVHLDEIPEDHKKALKTFLDFWTEHQKTLLDGDLIADNPLQNYSIVRSEKGDEIIAVAHSNPIFDLNKKKNLYFFNATDEKRLYIYTEKDLGNFAVYIKDCCGNSISESNIDLTAGIHYFDVPRSGMLSLLK